MSVAGNAVIAVGVRPVPVAGPARRTAERPAPGAWVVPTVARLRRVVAGSGVVVASAAAVVGLGLLADLGAGLAAAPPAGSAGSAASVVSVESAGSVGSVGPVLPAGSSPPAAR